MNLSTSHSNASDSFALLDERIQRWVWQSGWSELKDAQEQAIPAILAGDRDVVIAAATASGKTEAAFLPILTRLLSTQESSCVIYISPLKALINDQWWRLESLCETLAIPVTPWHGDISGSPKRKFKKSPVGCLLITPESLEALIIANGHALQALFGGLRYLVIDELHAFIGTERGKQLQSLMNRIDIALKRYTPRIALSATLGDMDKAAKFLRPNADKPVTIINSNDASQALKVLIKGFIDYPLPLASEATLGRDDADFEQSLSQGTKAISEHLFKTLRGSNNLVFPNSRGNVEKYAALLRSRCEDLSLPNEFWPHHGSLAKEVREETEAALKAKDRPATAICTTTLEMGIDIGAVKSIAQIGCAPSVASLRQRLGRSGRRGEAAILRCYALEAELAPHSPVSDLLRENLVQSIAQVRLSLRSWYEPPKTGALHLSTLIQQLLALIAQYGGINAANAWTILCGSGVFAEVSKQDFILLLRGLADKKILVQTPTGLLLHGRIGEQIVNHYSFYAAFSAEEEFRLVHGSKTLGSLPLSQPVEKGTHLIFAGKRWQVLSLDIEKKMIVVMPALGGKLPQFDGGNIPVDDGVREEMRHVFSDNLPIPFLDATANQLLKEARANFHRMGLATQAILTHAHATQIFLWRGDQVMNTVALMLKLAGFTVENAGIFINVKTDAPTKLFDSLQCLAASPPPEQTALVATVINKRLEKWDALLPDELLAKNYSSYALDVAGGHAAIKRLAQGL